MTFKKFVCDYSAGHIIGSALALCLALSCVACRFGRPPLLFGWFQSLFGWRMADLETCLARGARASQKKVMMMWPSGGQLSDKDGLSLGTFIARSSNHLIIIFNNFSKNDFSETQVYQKYLLLDD
jgi:hypothetical protein